MYDCFALDNARFVLLANCLLDTGTNMHNHAHAHVYMITEHCARTTVEACDSGTQTLINKREDTAKEGAGKGSGDNKREGREQK